jgi:hypothetical protein
MDNTNHYINIAIEAMQHTLSLHPRPFQQATISHVIRMNNNPSSLHPIQPCLLVQGTSGGKSSVYQMIGVIKAGITLIIESMLSLSSDQMSKISNICNTTDGVSSIQLDAIKKPEQQARVASSLLSLSPNTNRTIYIFSSPEALTKPIWSLLMKQLIQKKTLSLVCVDEVHLYVQFAITFRPSIISLKSLLFDLLHVSNQSNNSYQTLKVPVLFMTATFNKTLLDLLTKVTGLSIKSESTFWSDASSFARRNINIQISCTIYKMKVIKVELKRYLKGDDNNKAIIYSNVSSQVTSMREKIDSWLDSPDSLEGDTLIINGELPSEWKLISSQLFTNEVTNTSEKMLNNEYVPRILLATSGCIGAGLDSKYVVLVLRDGFPTSMVDLIQEMGRCGRSRNESTANNISIMDSFHLIVSLPSFTYLIERIFEDCKLPTDDIETRNTVISVDNCNKFQLDNIVEVVSFVFNSTRCWHITIEQKCENRNMANSEERMIHQPCGNRCPWCCNKIELYIKPIKKRGIIEFLVHVFIEKNLHNVTPKMLCNQLKSYPNVGSAIYGRRVTTPPVIVFLNSTILQLIGSKILKVEVNRHEESNKVITTLRLNYIFDDDNEFGRLAYTIDTYWSGFQFIS